MASGNKIVIAFLSVSTESSTDKLIEQIKRENYDFRCVFVKLTRQDLQLFQPGETYDAVVLLHSISQGRNSITDLADAKYSKFLPTLKKIYGPDRVAVVVHSMTSFNSNTKKALMMIFKKSQPTTFQCSKCVIQCNNLAEMLAADLSRLAEFLGEVPDHPLPIPEDEAHSTLTIAPSADKIDRIETGGKPQSIPVFASATTGDQSMTSSALSSTDTRSMSQTEVGRSENASAVSFDSGSPVDPLGVGLRTEVAPTQPTKGQTSITSTSSAGTGDGNTQNMASSTSQLGACSSYTAQASPKFDTSSYGYATQDTLIDTTYPIASVDLSSINSTSSASTGDVNPQNMASSTSQLGACSSDTAQVSQPPPKVDTSPNRYDTQEKVIDTTYPIASVDLSSINSTSSVSTGDVNPQNMASSTSQLGACSSDTAQVSQASPKVDTSPERYAAQDKVIDTAYPIALVNLSSENQPTTLKDDLQRRLPGKTIMLIKDINDLASNWHLFEAILLDLGSLQEAASYSSDEYKGALHIYQKCLKEMLVPQNLALLMLAPVDTHSADKHADIIRMISEIGKTREVSVFQYSRESCKPSLFDDNTKNRLFFWILDCYPRYHAAALQKGPGPSKNMQTQLAKYFPSISRLF